METYYDIELKSNYKYHLLEILKGKIEIKKQMCVRAALPEEDNEKGLEGLWDRSGRERKWGEGFRERREIRIPRGFGDGENYLIIKSCCC